MQVRMKGSVTDDSSKTPAEAVRQCRIWAGARKTSWSAVWRKRGAQAMMRQEKTSPAACAAGLQGPRLISGQRRAAAPLSSH